MCILPFMGIISLLREISVSISPSICLYLCHVYLVKLRTHLVCIYYYTVKNHKNRLYFTSITFTQTLVLLPLYVRAYLVPVMNHLIVKLRIIYIHVLDWIANVFFFACEALIYLTGTGVTLVLFVSRSSLCHHIIHDQFKTLCLVVLYNFMINL